jgi:hypothetical protein
VAEPAVVAAVRERFDQSFRARTAQIAIALEQPRS